MNRNPIPSKDTLLAFPLVRCGLALLALLFWLTTAVRGQTGTEEQGSVTAPAIKVTHVLGFEGAKHNAVGVLILQDNAVRFQRDGNPAARVDISSIHNIFLGKEDNQIGGVAMMLGKTAVPFGGGRVVSLFSHKKYDSLTIEYLDSTGGFHAAIFRLNKGQGQPFKKALIGNGAHIAPLQQSLPEVKNESK